MKKKRKNRPILNSSIIEEKTQYSKVQYEGLRYFKKLFLKNPTLLSDQAQHVLELFKKGQVSDLTVMEHNLISFVFLDKYENFFIDNKDLTKFFMETKIKADSISSIAKTIVENTKYVQTGQNINMQTRVVEKNNAYVYSFTGCCFTKNFSRSVFFLFQTNPNEMSLFLSNGDDVSSVPLISTVLGKEKIKSSLDFINENNDQAKMLRLILNMVLYMNAFPENVLNKPPDEICDKTNFGNSKTLSISAEISDYLHENRDVSPHLRRGHFKYLGSEYFKEKRGKTIFVKSTFVKGSAKTITGEKAYGNDQSRSI